MADNVELDAGSGGAVVATDDIGGFQYQRIKLVHGIDGASSGDVASTNPLPVTVSGVAGSVTIVGDIGVSSVAGNVTVVGNIGVSSLAGGSVTANIGTVSSLATQATLAQVSTFSQSTNTILAQPLSSNTFRVTIAVDDVGIGGGTQYAEDTTSTLPTGTVVLWKSAVSTLKAVSSSFQLPVSSAPLTANIGTVSSLATQATLGNVSTFTNSTNTLLTHVSSNTASTNALLSTQTLRFNNISTFTNSTNTILAQPLSSSTFRITIAADDVGIGGGTQYVEANTTTLPTGTVFLWKSAVSTLRPVASSFPLPVDVVSGSLNANTEYVEGDTSTAPTGIVMLWKSAVSTLRPVASSFPLPVDVVSGSLNANTEYVEGDTSTAPTGIVMLWKSAVSTLVAASTTNPFPVSTLPATVTANLGATDNTLLDNISTFTNSTNTLLIQVSSNTASTNAIASTISLRLAAVPTGIYTQPVAVSSNGLSVFRTLDADETEEQISATACTVYGLWVGNTSTTGVHVKLYNGTSSAIFVSSATPLITIPFRGSSTQAITGGVFNVE